MTEVVRRRIYCDMCAQSFDYDETLGPGGHVHVVTYDDRCKTAADSQGVTAIVEQMKGAGLDAWDEQTGGFCMVAAVHCADGHYVYAITEGASWYHKACPDFPDLDPEDEYCEGHAFDGHDQWTPWSTELLPTIVKFVAEHAEVK